MGFYLSEHKMYEDECIVSKTKQSGEIWQCRIWVSEDKAYIRKSLKTRNLETAKERAKKLYLETQGNLAIGKSPFSLTTRKGVDAYIQYRADDVGTRIVKGRLVTIKTHLSHWLKFIGRDTKLSELERRSCLGYFNWRNKTTGNKVKDVTLKNEQSTINAMWRYLYKERHTDFENFEFEKLSPVTNVDDIRRATLTDEEYRDLTNYLRTYCSQKLNKDSETYFKKQQFRLYVLILANSGMRVGELNQLTWKNVKTRFEKFNGKKLRVAEINVLHQTSKVRKDRIFISRRGDLFDELKELNEEFSLDKDLIFNTNGKSLSMDLLRWHWHTVMSDIGVENYRERKVTFYSLRHFFITQRIKNGASFAILSKVCGTSIKQIEDTYWHTDIKTLTNAVLASEIL